MSLSLTKIKAAIYCVCVAVCMQPQVSTSVSNVPKIAKNVARKGSGGVLFRGKYCLRTVQSTRCTSSFTSIAEAQRAISPNRLQPTSNPDIFEVIDTAYKVVQILHFVNSE